MDEHEVYERIQGIFVSGLVTIIGSGNSAAYGLPSMPQLASSLLAEIPKVVGTLGPACSETWDLVAERLQNDVGLEDSLTGIAVEDELRKLIADHVAERVGEAEVPALVNLSQGECPLGRLLFYILKTNHVADVITTNYDRLIEMSAIQSGVRVDTMFYGHLHGQFDHRLSRGELLKSVTSAGSRSSVRIVYHPHVRLAKPHGSLDWYEINGKIVRSDLSLTGERRVIVPGDSKYRAGYDIPYDAHRERATRAIDQAAAFLTLGYGFNDEHLQTHLGEKFKAARSVVMARTLTESAKRYVVSSDGRALGIEKSPDNASDTRIITTDTSLIIRGKSLWDLGALTTEVLSL